MVIALILRLLLMILLGLVGWEISAFANDLVFIKALSFATLHLQLIGAGLGAAVGFLIGPWVIKSLCLGLRDRLNPLSTRRFALGLIGFLIGLTIGALLTSPLSQLPRDWGNILPITISLILASLGTLVMIGRDEQLPDFLTALLKRSSGQRHTSRVVLDTSVIIDGRIADICQTGFIGGALIIPRFVLDELHHIADSTDTLRRNRGRRGLDTLSKLHQDHHVQIEVSEAELPESHDVDGKLIRLAQKLGCSILTNDYNLIRIAELQGVHVLNINELANAVKSVVLPGEILQLQIIQNGKEFGQGVAYLDDGTMVVVEDGHHFMNQTIEVAVTRVLQTSSGQMVFGQPVIKVNHPSGNKAKSWPQGLCILAFVGTVDALPLYHNKPMDLYSGAGHLGFVPLRLSNILYMKPVQKGIHHGCANIQQPNAPKRTVRAHPPRPRPYVRLRSNGT